MFHSLSFKIFLGRFLTRSGDQAWDFAVPITLIKIFPDQLRIAAAYFLIVKFMHVLLMPKVASIIDQKNRLHIAYLGSVIQLLGVLFGALSLLGLFTLNRGEPFWGRGLPLTLFIILGLSGLLSSLGSSLMNISVGNDLVPSAFPDSDLTRFNSRLRQLDLFTEVTAPVLAGLLLAINFGMFPLFGFILVALWNFISFVPEVLILRSVFRSKPELLSKPSYSFSSAQKTLLSKFRSGWASFFKQPVAPAVAAYALLWLSVLSPHGVLLTGYLKDGLKLPEIVIGIFRGLGALFGLLATVLFPIIVARFGLIKGSRYFILFQTSMLVLAIFFFWLPNSLNSYLFLIFILFSRIGLYGFSMGEMQIRQVGIAPHERGEVNGFADALTGAATLALYAFGTLLSTTEDFNILILGSVFFVGLGAIVFCTWKPEKIFSSS